MNEIAGKRVKVVDATLSGFVDAEGSVTWNVEVQVAPMVLKRMKVEPRLYVEMFPMPFAGLDALYSSEISIPDGAAFSEHQLLPGGRLCCVYLTEHEFLEQSRVVFSRDKAGALRLRWSARCASGVFGEVDFDLDAKAELLGINLGARRKRDLAKLRLDPTGLHPHEEDGTLYLLPD